MMGCCCIFRWMMAAAVAVGTFTAANETPFPRPKYCKEVSTPQIDYSRSEDYITYYDDTLGNPLNTGYLVAFNLSLKGGRLAVDYPQLFCIDGSCVRRLENSSGSAYLNTLSGTGQVTAEFDVESINIGHGDENQNLTGRMRIVSTDFLGFNDEYVPFMRRQSNGPSRYTGGAVTGTIMMHGATGQAEAGFPLLRVRVAAWGHCDVYLNGQLKYGNLWFHTKYSNTYRSPETGEILVDKCAPDQKKCTPKLYNRTTDGMLQPVVYPKSPMQFTLTASRFCKDPNPLKVHGNSDLDILTDWEVESL